MNSSAYYEITVRGQLRDALMPAFGGLTATNRAGHTVLHGELDQSALFGVLDQIASLGLDLLDVRSTCPPFEGRPHPPQPNP
jgi:hypothetical protein